MKVTVYPLFQRTSMGWLLWPEVRPEDEQITVQADSRAARASLPGRLGTLVRTLLHASLAPRVSGFHVFPLLVLPHVNSGDFGMGKTWTQFLPLPCSTGCFTSLMGFISLLLRFLICKMGPQFF